MRCPEQVSVHKNDAATMIAARLSAQWTRTTQPSQQHKASNKDKEPE